MLSPVMEIEKLLEDVRAYFVVHPERERCPIAVIGCHTFLDSQWRSSMFFYHTTMN